MRSSIFFLLFITFFSSLLSCDEQLTTGSLLITVKYDSELVGQATIYIKAGTLQNPNIGLKDYDYVQRADGSGQAYFSKLLPGNYYIYAVGYHSNTQVSGDSGLTIAKHTRQNVTKVTVMTF